MNNNNSPTLRRESLSPQRLGSSLALSDRSRPKRRPELSPRKSSPYTICHPDKLKVFVKFKPPASTNSRLINVTYLNEKEVEIERQSSHNKIYSYDHVFHEAVKPETVFSVACADVIDEVVAEGKYGLIFVYGHTGTGKTYTMGLLDSVNHSSRGIVPDSLRYIFAIKNRLTRGAEGIKVSLSFNEIYMDEVYDMLDFEGDKKLLIRESQGTREPYIENNICITINNVEEAYELLNIGLDKRKVAEQKINKRSSRGHGIITVNVTLANGRCSRLCFVDLAGSERVKESESSGKILAEAVHINASLSALEALLMNIGEQSVRMYRANKLTRLLQPFMESGKIRLLVTSNYENIQPLEFGKRCKGIKFMEREVEAPEMSPNRISSSNISNAGVKCPAGNKQMEKCKATVLRLQQQNKNLTHNLTNVLLLLQKIMRLSASVMEEQNTQSNFTLNDDSNNQIVSAELERRANGKIEQLERAQQQIIQACFTNNLLLSVQAKDDSSATNSSVHRSCSQPNDAAQTQKLVLAAKQEPQIFNKTIHELGFAIFHSLKQLGQLCQYKNIYKKQLFTETVKAEVLVHKNRQLESATNCLLKSCGDQAGNLSKKVLKQLKQIGLNLVPNTHKKATTAKNELGPELTRSMRKTSHHDPKKNPVKHYQQGFGDSGNEFLSYDYKNLAQNARSTHYNASNQIPGEDALFHQHENNSNYLNRNTSLAQQKSEVPKNSSKAIEASIKTASIGGTKNGRRTGGLILIQDL